MVRPKKETEEIGDVQVVDVKPAEESALARTFAQTEIDSQIATAQKFPRSIKDFKNKLMMLATLDEDTAASCFYALPRAGRTITGPSVRMAEIALSCYRNCIVQGDVSHEDAKYIYAIGMCRDLENNVAVRVTVRRRITKRDGSRFDDDMMAVTANAAISIAVRNAIFRIVPTAYIRPVFEAVQQTAIGKVETMVNTRARAFAFLQKMGVDEPKVLQALRKKSIEDVGRDEIALLKGFVTAIKDGEASVDTIFPEVEPEKDLAAEPVKKATGKKAKPKSGTKTNKPKAKDEKEKTTKKSNLF